MLGDVVAWIVAAILGGAVAILLYLFVRSISLRGPTHPGADAPSTPAPSGVDSFGGHGGVSCHGGGDAGVSCH